MLPLSKVTAATLAVGVLSIPKGKHALLGASSAEALFLCPGRGALSGKVKNEESSSVYAAWGTAAHELAAMCLHHTPAAHPRGVVQHYGIDAMQVGERTIDVTDEMIDCVHEYVKAVTEIKADDGVVWVEQTVSWARYTNGVEADEWGTADAVVFLPNEIVVLDFKTGKNSVIPAKENPQLYLYALGALAKVEDLLGQTPAWVTVGISQPRLGVPLVTHRLSTVELLQWAEKVAAKGFATARAAADSYRSDQDKDWQTTYLNPGEKQCGFCNARPQCPALKREVLQAMQPFSAAKLDEFDDVTVGALDVTDATVEQLAEAMRAVPLIEAFCKAVQDEVSARLAAGQQVPGFKFVLGRQGNRVWSGAEADTYAALQQMGFKAESLWSKTLISPAKVDNLAKSDKIIKAAWDAGQAALVNRSPASKTVVLEADPRPAVVVTPVIEDFIDETMKAKL